MWIWAASHACHCVGHGDKAWETSTALLPVHEPWGWSSRTPSTEAELTLQACHIPCLHLKANGVIKG